MIIVIIDEVPDYFRNDLGTSATWNGNTQKEWFSLNYEPVSYELNDDAKDRIVNRHIFWLKPFGGIIRLVFKFGEFIFQLSWWRKTEPILSNYTEPILVMLYEMRHYFTSLQRWYAGRGSRRIKAY